MPKVVEASLIARFNIIGSDLKHKFKSLLKGFNSVGSYCLVEPNSVWYRYFHFFFLFIFFFPFFLPKTGMGVVRKSVCYDYGWKSNSSLSIQAGSFIRKTDS
jgi:hypothetical protein